MGRAAEESHVMNLRINDVGRMKFDDAYALQEQTVAARKQNAIPDTLILVEHEPVYTLGRNADPANILATPEELKQRGIEVVQTSRGGQVTYHGPGQLVGYPVIDLSARNKGALWYVDHLEQMLLNVLSAFDLKGKTDADNRGVWIEDDKIAALGVKITRGVTMHGFALNVTVNLGDYANIVPCGIQDKGVTSLNQFRPEVTLEQTKPIVAQTFQDVFGYDHVE